jgi:hypothetical protein
LKSEKIATAREFQADEASFPRRGPANLTAQFMTLCTALHIESIVR